ncbi:MAG: hypothetical protein U9R40_04220 [Synergistota bacterium]|nr:hypothetical protein [Synergistota bacterium]
MKKLIILLIILAAAGGAWYFTSSRGVTTQDVKEETSEAVETAGDYLKQEKAEFVESMQNKLETIQKDIDKLREEASDKSADGKDILQEKIDALETQWGSTKSKLQEVRSAGTEQWESLRDGAVSMYDRLKNAYDAAKRELTD